MNDRTAGAAPRIGAGAAAVFIASAAWSASTLAQEFPVRPLRFIVPFAPGGGLDITARLVAPGLSQTLGKPVVVDNRPGAGGAVALEIAAKAGADGHVLVMASASHVIQAILVKSRFDFFRDLAPVTEILATPYLLISYPGLPAKTVRELVDYAKAQAGKLVYGSAGHGTLQHLAMELFLQATGTRALQVPYKGMGAAMPDVFAGRVHIMMSSLASLATHVRSGAVRALAITGSERSQVFPELPTMSESGVAGFVVQQWQGVLVPAGTPPAIVQRLQHEIARTLDEPEWAAYLKASDSKAVGSSPQTFKAKLDEERVKWSRVIAKAGLR